MQIPQPDSRIQELIYENYYNFYVVDSSEALVPHYRTPFIDFLSKLVIERHLSKGDLLEIGCSSGEKVELLASFSQSYTGIDPSGRINLAINKFPQHSFIQGYFPDAIPNKKFDVVVSQFNLEHIQDVRSFLSKIHQATNENGILIVQVPDCGHYLRTEQPNFLAHEHIQYFIKETLTILLRTTGFSPIAWGEEGASLIAAAIRTAPHEAELLTAQSNIQKAKAQTNIFNNYPDIPEAPLIFYGVGPQLYWLLSYYKGDLSKCDIIDDNPNYENQGLPGYSNIIKRASKELFQNNKPIILSLNKIYHERVIERIKSLAVKCSIYYLKQNSFTILNHKPR